MNFDVSSASAKSDAGTMTEASPSTVDFDKRVESSDSDKSAPSESKLDLGNQKGTSEQKEAASSETKEFNPDKRIETQEDHEIKLSEEVKQKLEDAGMSPANIESCTMDENGVVQLKTINSDLEGKKHPDTGVKYVRKTLDLNGIKVEGVFPQFDDVFECKLSPDMLKASDLDQFKACMSQLRDKIESNPELAKKFNEVQLEQIKDPDAARVRGFTWHHNEQTGEMQLVDANEHALTKHTGGKSVWGGGSAYRN